MPTIENSRNHDLVCQGVTLKPGLNDVTDKQFLALGQDPQFQVWQGQLRWVGVAKYSEADARALREAAAAQEAAAEATKAAAAAQTAATVQGRETKQREDDLAAEVEAAKAREAAKGQPAAAEQSKGGGGKK